MNRTHKLTNHAKAIMLLIGALTLSSQALGDGSRRPYDLSHHKRMYVRADVGGSILEFGKLNHKTYDTKFKPSVVYAVGVGYDINNRVRTDFTFSHRAKYSYKVLPSLQSISSMALMLNGYYTVIEGAFAPYVMAGLGAARHKAGDYKNVGAESLPGRIITTFAWQAGAGLVYKFNDSIHTDLGYRYVSANVAQTSNILSPSNIIEPTGSAKTRMKSHECTIGLIYKF